MVLAYMQWCIGGAENQPENHAGAGDILKQELEMEGTGTGSPVYERSTGEPVPSGGPVGKGAAGHVQAGAPLSQEKRAKDLPKTAFLA